MSVAPVASAEIDHHLLFNVVPDAYGNRLALVFGNQAPGGVCPYYAASLCHHCDIGRGEGSAFDLLGSRRRLRWYQEFYSKELPSVAHLVIYNSGSVLNPLEMSEDFLHDILSMARGMPRLKEISLDSRETYVTAARLRRIADQLRADQRVRVILGIESADEHIRNELLQKRMSTSRIQRAFSEMALTASYVASDRIGADVNILVGAPGTTPATAALDAANTAAFAMDHSQVPVDFNLHPYYRSARGSERFPSHQRCSLSLLLEALQAIRAVGAHGDRRPRIFIGLNDEGHDLESRDDSGFVHAAAAIRAFNSSQDMAVLQSVTDSGQ